MRLSFLLAPLAASTVVGVSWIAPGAIWYDTEGHVIDAHGGGIYKEGHKFYWVGHSAPDNTTVTPKLYSSEDLLNWKFLGQVANSTTGMWRTKLIKLGCDYWLYGQQNRQVLSLKSKHIKGQYERVAKVNLPPNNYTYSDTGIFHDEDAGKHYLLTSADHNTVQINEIYANGSIGAQASRLTAGPLEAPGMFKQDDIYFLIVSAKTGYRPDPNKVYWATSLNGPWSGGTDIAPPEEKTYNSQNSFELTINGSETTTHLYLGDRWTIAGDSASTYLWLPMNVNTTSKNVTLEWHDLWKVDVKTGVVSYPTTEKRYAPDRSKLSKKSAKSEVTFEGVKGTGSLQWLRLHYTTKGPEVRETYIVVNDEKIYNISDLNSHAGQHSTTSVQLKLESGTVNKISIGIHDEDMAIDVDALEIFKDDFELPLQKPA